MKNRSTLRAAVRAAMFCGLVFATSGSSFSNRINYRTGVDARSQKEKKVSPTNHASGTFEVKMTSPTSEANAAALSIGRFSLDKKFSGDLEGTSKGEMLAISATVPGSAGYVAMEQVTGKLNGRTGTFALQHTGTMNRGAAQLSVTVVPDSGTGELVGLSGRMDIKITDGKHFYEFDYVLP